MNVSRETGLSDRLDIHFVTPLPPARTEIANYAMAVLPALAARCRLVVWTDQVGHVDVPGIDIRNFAAHGLPSDLTRADAVFFNLGNHLGFHGRIFEALRRIGGIAILHDPCMQHFFSCRAHVSPRCRDDYLGAMRHYHGRDGEIAGRRLLIDMTGIDAAATLYPLTGMAVDAAQAVVTHSRAVLPVLAALGKPAAYIPLVYDCEHLPALPRRRKHDVVRLVVAGHLGANRGLSELVAALDVPDLRNRVELDVYGEVMPGIAADFAAQLAGSGLGGQVRVHGRVSEAVLEAGLGRADLAINLRIPTMGEASASQLRYWSHALPSVVSRDGWYATLPDDAVLFVTPGREIEELREHVRGWFANRDRYAAMGRRGRALLLAEHGASAYADALVAFAGSLQARAALPAAAAPGEHSEEQDHAMRIPTLPPTLPRGTVLTRSPTIEGYVDFRDVREISGWAHIPGSREARVTVSLAVRGMLVDEVAADRFRADVLAAGFGDGCYGFTLRMPDGVDLSAPIRVVAHGAEQEAVLLDTAPAADRAIGLPATLRAQRPWRTLYFEITDLLHFMASVAHVSGIQRVQLGYLVTLLHDRNVQFAMYSVERRHFVQVSRADVVWLVGDCAAAGGGQLAQRQQRIHAMLAAPDGAALAAGDGDVLLGTGCYWHFPGWFGAIRRMKQRAAIRYVQIAYDAVPVFCPESTHVSQVAPFSKAITAMLCHADAVLSISQATSSDLRRIVTELQIPAPPIGVVPMGTGTDYGSEIDDALTPVPRGLTDFVLCVGTIEPRKNHLYLYHVWKRLLAWPQQQIPRLVFVGRFGWHTEELQRHLEVSNNLDGHIVILPSVTDAELRALYRECRFTVFPSLYEGWGLPVSESLAMGKLCVASNSTAIPEAGGDWALYVDPYNVEDGVRTVMRLLADPEAVRAREAAIAQGYRTMPWPVAAERMLDRLAGLLGGAAPMAGPLPVPLLVPGTTLEAPTAPDDGSPMVIARRQLQLLDFTAVLDGEGWKEAENWGVWASGNVARLVFRLPEDQGAMQCYLRVLLPPWYGSQTIDLVLDGRLVGQPTISAQPRSIMVRVGARKGGLCELELRLRDMLLPPEDLVSAQVVGIGLMHLHVVPESDVMGRLSYLETNMLG